MNNYQIAEELKKYAINKTILGNWIDSLVVEEAVITDIVIYMTSSEATFEQACEAYCLNKNNTLAVKSKAYFYAVCSSAMLLADGDEKISEVMRNSTTDIQKRIILNCLKNIPDNKYSEYENVWNVIYNACGRFNELKYQRFFADEDKIYEQNYRLWFSVYELNITFGNSDERSIFWRKICIENRNTLKLCRFYKHNEAILMQFGEMYVIEFKIHSGGAVYIIQGDYYNNIIKRKFENPEIKMNNLKNFLFSLNGYTTLQMIRCTHQGFWMPRVRNSFYALYNTANNLNPVIQQF